MPPATAVLAVDLAAIRANYRLLTARHARGRVAAVVKADAYGLGMKAVAPALWAEGCRAFFVATPDEGAALRRLLPLARIGVFNGLLPGQEARFLRLRLAPVLNDAGQVARWMARAAPDQPAMLHVDTGMTRLGLTLTELTEALTRFPALPRRLACVLSHLACGDMPDHPKNLEQLARFLKALSLLPGVPASLANSSGHFLPGEFHFDLGRPGCALYGITPVAGENPMQPVARLSAPLLQVRRLDRAETVGYGATATLPAGSRVALAALGYADGWPRLLSGRGSAFIGGVRVPVVGRVSMDMTALDVSALPEALLAQESGAEFLNTAQTVDAVAEACGTIGYEILTGIGPRVRRVYRQSKL